MPRNFNHGLGKDGLRRAQITEFIRDQKKPLILGGAALSMVVVSCLPMLNSHDTTPAEVFTTTFTEEDGCLTDTGYSPANGARIEVTHEFGETIISSIPMRVNEGEPAVLNVHYYEGNEQPFAPADYITGGFMYQIDCPGFDQPY